MNLLGKCGTDLSSLRNKCDDTSSAASAAIELNPAFQSWETIPYLPSVAAATVDPANQVNRRRRDWGRIPYCPGFGRAKLTRSLRDRENSCYIYFSENLSPSNRLKSVLHFHCATAAAQYRSCWPAGRVGIILRVSRGTRL